MQNKYDTDVTLKENSSLTYIIQSIKPGTTVLEFGPATGYMTRYLKENLKCKVYIVEIDVEAYGCAIQYAENGLCGNAENLEWKTKFSDIRFDYITFADVLEHLIDPWKVLEASTQLLKESSGEILVSLPNIAHNAVLIDLFNDKFEYRKTGIMDNTHLRFFTRKSAEEMFRKCNLSVIKEDVVKFDLKYAGLDNSEFDVPENVWAELRLRDAGYVNQYLFTLTKEKMVCADMPNHGTLYESALYYSSDDIYSEEHKVAGEIILSGNSFRAKYFFPNPVELNKMKVDLLTFGGKIGELKLNFQTKVSSIKEIDGYKKKEESIFYSDAIRYEFVLTSPAVMDEVEIVGKIYTVQVSELGKYLTELIHSNTLQNEAYQQEIGRLNTVILEKQRILDVLQDKVKETEEIYRETERLNIVLSEKQDIIHDLQTQVRKKETLKQEVDRLNKVVDEKQKIIHEMQVQANEKEGLYEEIERLNLVVDDQ